MSSTPQGPGWWQASDGNWYPPEQAPGAQPTPPPTPPPSPAPTPTPAPAPTPGAAPTPGGGLPGGGLPGGGLPQGRSGASRQTRTPSPAEIAVMAGGGVVLIVSFLAFYSASGFSGASVNAWDTGLFPIATLIVLWAVAAGVLVALGVFGVSLPDRLVTFTRAQIVLVCGVFATVQCLAYMIVEHTGADLGIGFWFMLVGSIAVLVGGVMELRAADAR